MTSAAQFAAEVRRRIEAMPYQVVDETPDGFAMHVDIVDAQWWSLYRRNGLQKTWRWEVAVKGDSYQITDRAAELSWQAGATGGDPRPTLEFAASVQKGTQVSIQKQKTYAIDDEGQFGKVVDYSFDSREGKKILTDAAEQLGLKRGWDWQTKVGAGVAILTVLVLIVGFGIIGLIRLLG